MRTLRRRLIVLAESATLMKKFDAVLLLLFPKFNSILTHLR